MINMPGFLKINFEKGLFLAFALLLGLFLVTRDSFSHPPVPQARSLCEMPSPPEIVPWQLSDFLILDRKFYSSVAAKEGRDPFRASFNFPAEAKPEVKPVEKAPEPAVTPLPPPKPHTTTVKAAGFFSSLSGKKYVMLELDDSRSGRQNLTCSEGEELFSGFSVREINHDFTVIALPGGTTVNIPWEKAHTFRRDEAK